MPEREKLLGYPMQKNMTQRPAHSIKPGDITRNDAGDWVEVADLLRDGFGGSYLPMVDGTRRSNLQPNHLLYVK